LTDADDVERRTFADTPEQLMLRLGTSRDGLDHAEVKERSARDGPNEIAKVRKSFIRKVAPQIFDFVILLLLAIAVLMAVLTFLFPPRSPPSRPWTGLGCIPSWHRQRTF